jgi:shikimate kinase
MIMQEIRMTKPIVLIGMMGAGKSSLGTRLAKRLKLAFVDADAEVEAAAGISIAEIFEAHGEAAFRDGERRVIARLLKAGPQVLALGGGAFVDAATRAEVLDKAISIWLDVPVDELVERVKRKPGKRPLLANTNVHEKLTTLMRERGPLYAEADIRADISGKSHDAAIDRLVDLLRAHV